MSKRYNCCVISCSNSTKIKKIKGDNNSVSISFFRFPKKLELKKQWLQILNKNKVEDTDRICSDHFEKKFVYMKGACKQLKADALPTIFASSSVAVNRDHLMEININLPNLIGLGEETNANRHTQQNIPIEMNVDELNLSSSSNSTVVIPETEQGEDESAIDMKTVSSDISSGETSPVIENMDRVISVYRKKNLNKLKPVKKVTLKNALKTTTSGESSSPKKKIRRKMKLKLLRSSYKELKKRHHNLEQKILRRNRKIDSLETVLQDLKSQNHLQEEHLINLLAMTEPVKELLKRQLRKTKGLSLPKSYPIDIRKFAMNLNFYSPKGYDYVRKIFSYLLPHPKTIGQWYKCVKGNAGFTEESFHTLRILVDSDGFNNYIFCNLVFDEINIRSQVEWDGKKSVGLLNRTNC